MALIKTDLKEKIESLMTDMRKREEVSDSDFADQLAAIIDDYVKSATITVSGVVTAGGPTTQTQTLPVTATIN